jgi:hypothetical protein
MDRAQRLRDLEKAERHVVEGEGQIAKQEQIVAELDRDGHDTTEAKGCSRTSISRKGSTSSTAIAS